MADINKIIDELLLELSVTYPFPNMKDKEQVIALMEICDDLGYGYIKPNLYELLSEAEDEKESGLFPGKFHLGGGYYSSKDGGEAEFKNDKGNLRPVTPEEKAKFDAKSGKTPSAEKPTAPKPNEPSTEAPPTEQPKDTPAEAPAPMKQAPVVKTPADVLKSKVEKWSETEKEFFKKGEDKPGSPTRRSFGQALKDKAKGARNAIVHGFKHEVHTFKSAAGAAKKLVSGKPLEKEEKKALISVGIKVASTALFAAAGGGLAHGAAYFAKHVAMELIPHAVVETIIVGVGRASLFAGADGDDERILNDFMESVADNMENMEIPEELMMSMVDSYNQKKKPNEEQSEVIDLNELFNRILNEEDDKGESKEFPGKFHLGGGYYSSTAGGAAELKNDKGSLRPLTDKEKEELSKGDGGTDEGEPSDSDKPDTASMIDTATKALDDKEKEAEKTLPKDNPDLVLNDPKASAKNKSMAKAFKAQQSVELNKKKDDPNYEKELKAEINTKIESAKESLKNRKTEDGDTLDSETTDNGSLIVGVEHGDGNESTQEVIKLIKSLPKDAKVMFVGEGGMSRDDNGELELAGEQSEIRDAVKGHFDNSDESSWDENANVYDDNSPVFDEVAKELGGSKSKSKASIWSNMVGQGDELDSADYLDEEGKKWLIDQAKKGGSSEFEGEVDWDNLTLEQKEDLYQLNFRDDEGYGETEISKGQKAYNEFRQKELDRKIKEAEEAGYTVIAPVGNSHVDMWRNRNKPKKSDFKAQSLRTLQKELPEADKDVFNKESDLDKIPSDKKEEISMKIDELASKAGKGEDFNLCQITVPGTNLYCDDNQGIPREEMPQFKGKPLPGTPSEDLPKDKNGEVDTEPLFKKMLKEKGIKTIETELPSDKLKATQSELVGSKVAGMTKALEEDPNNPGITAPIYVSRDGFVIDGHHRWAAVTSAAIKDGKPANMKVIVVDMDIKDAIPMCNQFAEEQGIAAKKADARDGELPTPKEPNEKEGGVIYPLGGGYYSDTKGGTAQYIKSESVVNKIFIEENIKFINLLFEDNLTMQTPSGKEVMVKSIDVKDQPEANKEVEQAKEEAPNVDVATARKNLQISDKVIQTNIAKAEKHIDNSEADDSTKEILKDTISKILKGEDVDPANSEIASKWLSVRTGGGNDIGIYIAKTEGDFKSKSREKITMDIDPKKVQDIDSASDEWNDTMMNKYGLSITTQTGAFVNKKDWTANKMNKKRKKVKFETSEDGNSVTVEGVTYTKRPVPDKQTLVEHKNLVEQFIKQGSSEEEANEEARKVIAAIERGNAMVDKLSKDGEMEVVDYGPTDTNDNRRKTLKNTIDKTRKSILKAIKKYSGLSEKEILEKYADLFKSLDEIEKSAPINNPNWDSMSSEEKEKASAEYLNKLTDVLQNIRRDKDIASGGPDIAEVLVFMNEIGKGNQAFLPSSSNFPTVDIVSFNEQKTPPENATPEELAEFYANEYSANSISFIDSDAESIKLGKGGASAGPSKTDGSTFNNEKTKEVLNSMMSSYNAIYGDYPPSKEAIDKAEEDYKVQRAHMIEILIGQGKSPEQAERMVSDVEKKATEGENSAYQQARRQYQKSIKPEELDPEFDRGLKLYNKTGMLFEMMFNEDVKSNNFGNVRFIESGAGARTRISMEVLDGINEKCCVKFNANPGEMKIKGDASGKRKAGINVSYSTWITKCKK